MTLRPSHLLAVLLAGLPALALAHPGHAAHGFVDGFVHPFLGADHLLAMLLVGLWSALGARRVWAAPLCFVVMLSCGALLGQAGLTLPGLEVLVAASVPVLGALLTLRRTPGDAPVLALIGAFATAHGMAHGAELASGGAVLAGIVGGSALLHAGGIGIARSLLADRPQLVRRTGQALAVIGSALVVSAAI